EQSRHQLRVLRKSVAVSRKDIPARGRDDVVDYVGLELKEKPEKQELALFPSELHHQMTELKDRHSPGHLPRPRGVVRFRNENAHSKLGHDPRYRGQAEKRLFFTPSAGEKVMNHEEVEWPLQDFTALPEYARSLVVLVTSLELLPACPGAHGHKI